MSDTDSLGLLQRPFETMQLPAMPSPVVRLPCPTTLTRPASYNQAHFPYNTWFIIVTKCSEILQIKSLFRFILPPLVLS